MTLALKAKAQQSLIDVRVELGKKKNLDAAASNMHKVLRVEIKKDKGQFKEEKRKLELIIANLLKQKEGTRAKIKKIFVISS